MKREMNNKKMCTPCRWEMHTLYRTYVLMIFLCAKKLFNFVAKLARLYLTFLSLSDVLKSLWKLKIPRTHKRRQGTSKKDDKKNKTGRTYHWENSANYLPFHFFMILKKEKRNLWRVQQFYVMIRFQSGLNPIRTETN